MKSKSCPITSWNSKLVQIQSIFGKLRLRLAQGKKAAVSSFVRFQVLFLRICISLTLCTCTFSVPLSGVTLNLPELESFQPFFSSSSLYMRIILWTRTGPVWSYKSFISTGQGMTINSIKLWKFKNDLQKHKNSFSNPIDIRNEPDTPNETNLKQQVWSVLHELWDKREDRDGWRYVLVNGTFW